MQEERILDGLREIYRVIKRQNELLEEIAGYLGASQPAPNIKRPIEEFRSFDWSSIGASIINTDEFGVAQVSWRGRIYTRRSPENKFKQAIFFSACIGKDENGNNKYERLIIFTTIDPAEPLGRKTEKLINSYSENGSK